ncbi:MAG: hypothetical protein KC503_16130 [Myxococcales bacterium]|nr:hypothetical protein [Myxococcales bacterium]
MKKLLVLCAPVVCVALGGASLHAAPNWIITPLARKVATNGCTASGSSASMGDGFQSVGTNGANTGFFCAVDTVTVAPSQITRAVVWVKLLSTPQPAWAQLCYRSLATGHHLCGKLAYSKTASASITALTPPAPTGSFDDSYAAYLLVMIPRPATSVNTFYGYELQKVTETHP